MNNSKETFEYDIQKRARASTRATLRAAVAIYIIYLGRNVIMGVREGTSTMAPWIGWSGGLLFIAAGLGFAVYAWRRWRAELEASKLPCTKDAAGPEDPPV